MSIGFTTITRPMIEENTISMEMAQAPTLDELGLARDEQRQLAKIGVRNAAQLKTLQRSAGEDTLSRYTGVDLGRIRGALNLARPRVEDVVAEPGAGASRDPGETSRPNRGAGRRRAGRRQPGRPAATRAGAPSRRGPRRAPRPPAARARARRAADTRRWPATSSRRAGRRWPRASTGGRCRSSTRRASPPLSRCPPGQGGGRLTHRAAGRVGGGLRPRRAARGRAMIRTGHVLDEAGGRGRDTAAGASRRAGRRRCGPAGRSTAVVRSTGRSWRGPRGCAASGASMPARASAQRRLPPCSLQRRRAVAGSAAASWCCGSRSRSRPRRSWPSLRDLDEVAWVMAEPLASVPFQCASATRR